MVDSPSPKPILLLDVMDTLVVDPFFEAIPRFFGLSLEELLQQKHPDSWIDFEKAAISEAQYMERYFADRRTVDADALRSVLWESYDWLPGAELLLAELHAVGVEMHAVSNYSLWYRIIEEKLRLSRFVQWTFVSCHTGLRKPDKRCYEFALQALAVEPEACLFADDRRINTDAARALGIDSIQSESPDHLRRELETRGVV